MNKIRSLSRQKFLLYLFGLSCLLSTTVQAAKAGPTQLTTTQYFSKLQLESPFSAEWMKTANPAAPVKGLRSPAQAVAPDESTLTPELRKFRDTMLTTKSPDEIDGLLDLLDSQYDTYPDSFKFVAAQFIALKPMRGVLWRVIPLLERNTMLHSMLLSFARTAAAQIRVYYPTDQWDAGFAYLTQPYLVQDKLVAQIDSEEKLQAFLGGTVYQALLKATTRIEALNLSAPMTWDNKIFYGPASYQDSVDRYRLVGEVERLSTLASLHSDLAQLSFQRAYSLQGAINLYAELGRLYGFDGIFTGNVSGAPASERTAVVRESKFANIGRLFPDGALFTKLSLHHLREAAKNTDSAWVAMQGRPASEAYVINSGAYLAAPRVQNIRIAQMSAILRGPAQVRSAATGMIAEVNLPEFYEHPPQDLKSLLATSFEEGGKWTKKSLTLKNGSTTNVAYRNFFEGRPNGWNISALSPYFPGIKSSEDVMNTARILDEAYGGFEAALPLAFIVR